MKKTLLAVFAGVGLMLSLSPAASADSFLSISVSGSGTISCDNSTAAGVTACGVAGFTTTLHSDTISTTATPLLFGGYSINSVNLTGNSPGSPLAGFATDTKTAVTDVSATAPLVVSFAQNNFTLPAGAVLNLSASQAGTGTVVASSDTGAFTGYGDGLTNSLVPTTGIADVSPLCTVGVAPPESSCSTAAAPTTFSRTGPYALSGVETLTMHTGDTISFSGTVAAAPVPEPSSVLLLGTGMILLAGRRLRRKQQQ